MTEDEPIEPEIETWAPLAAANKRVLIALCTKRVDDAVAAAASQLHEEQDEESRGTRHAGDEKERRDEEHRQYVERRLREMREFERRADGKEF